MDEPSAILLFDGWCNLCSRSVQFILRNEKTGSSLRFASLQSEAGKVLLAGHGIQSEYVESLVLIEKDRVYMHSGAALRTASYLRRPYSWLRFGLFFPKGARDYLYKIIARNRYRWFGTKAECWVPTPALSGRFL